MGAGMLTRRAVLKIIGLGTAAAVVVPRATAAARKRGAAEPWTPAIDQSYAGPCRECGGSLLWMHTHAGAECRSCGQLVSYNVLARRRAGLPDELPRPKFEQLAVNDGEGAEEPITFHVPEYKNRIDALWFDVTDASGKTTRAQFTKDELRAMGVPEERIAAMWTPVATCVITDIREPEDAC